MVWLPYFGSHMQVLPIIHATLGEYSGSIHVLNLYDKYIYKQ